ncbi:DUF357 domain-containing protein [Candidatus Altiarchaeota archaeon]
MSRDENSLKEKLEGYLAKAKPLFEDLEAVEKAGIPHATVKHFKEMASSYYKDALHFHEQGDYVNALGALEYAEGWLDAGKTMGIFRKE